MTRLITVAAFVLALGLTGLVLNIAEIEHQRGGAIAVLICDP